MAAIGEQPEHITALIIRQANGATRIGTTTRVVLQVLVVLYCFRIQKLRVAQDGGIIEPHLQHHEGGIIGRQLMTIPAAAGCGGGGGG